MCHKRMALMVLSFFLILATVSIAVKPNTAPTALAKSVVSALVLGTTFQGSVLGAGAGPRILEGAKLL